jgi:putrescine transport system substrate-binding protein
MKMKFTLAMLGLAAAAAIGLAGPARADEEKVLNVYNWSDYIGENTVKTFEKQTGIKVNYDVYDSNETLETKLLTGHTGYDVVVPSGGFLGKQIQAGVFGLLDKAKLPNLKNMDESIMKAAAQFDPDNAHSVPYFWGTVGIGYNVKRARQVLGPAGEINSWNTVFGAGELMKFKDCGVHMLDSADDILPAALHYLGRDPNSTDAGDLEKAADLVAKVRPAVRKFHSSEYLNALASGEICLVVGWSGDVKQAQKRAAEAASGIEIGYAVPKEGAQMFFDNLAIPQDARNVEEAHAFIDYMLRPEVAAKNTSFLSYANGNLASQSLIDPAILADRTIYPDDATMARLYTINAHDARTTRLMNRLWTRIKTGI